MVSNYMRLHEKHLFALNKLMIKKEQQMDLKLTTWADSAETLPTTLAIDIEFTLVKQPKGWINLIAECKLTAWMISSSPRDSFYPVSSSYETGHIVYRYLLLLKACCKSTHTQSYIAPGQVISDAIHKPSAKKIACVKHK